MISVRAALDQAVARLEAAGIEDPRLDAKYLMAEILDKEPVGLSLYGDEQLATDQLIAFNDFINRREEREPVSKILERRSFYGLDFIISSGTLDPRADSEALIDLALSLPNAQTVLDLGTGTGCLMLSYLHERPNAVGTGTDSSREAIAVAKENANALGLQNRAEFAFGIWTTPIKPNTTFDLVMSNPPYVRDDEYDDLQPEVQHWDPPTALFAGPDGLAAYRQIFQALPTVTHTGSYLCLEIGKGQGPDVKTLGQAAGWMFLQGREDLSGIERALAFKKSSGN